MEDIRRKCNPMIDLSKFTFNKKKKIYIYIYIKWSYNLNLQPSLLSNFVLSLFMFGLKKFRMVTNFF